MMKPKHLEPDSHIGDSHAKEFFVPLDTQSSEIFIDESGSKASRSNFFVLGMIKSRDTGLLARHIRGIREKHRFWDEFHFSEATQGSKAAYFDACELLGISDVRISAYVFDKSISNPFAHRTTWRTQADCAARLVRGNINMGEIVSVYLDIVTTPNWFSIAENVKQQVNDKFGKLAVVSALDLDSKSSDLLQMADLVAGAVAYYRRTWSGQHPDSPDRSNNTKAQIMRRLMRCFDLNDFEDVRTGNGKVNIQTAGRRKDAVDLQFER